MTGWEIIMNIGFGAFALDNINEDGSAILLWWKGGAEPNEELKCADLAEMCTAKEIFALLVKDESVEIEDGRVWKFCTPND